MSDLQDLKDQIMNTFLHSKGGATGFKSEDFVIMTKKYGSMHSAGIFNQKTNRMTFGPAYGPTLEFALLKLKAGNPEDFLKDLKEILALQMTVIFPGATHDVFTARDDSDSLWLAKVEVGQSNSKLVILTKDEHFTIDEALIELMTTMSNMGYDKAREEAIREKILADGMRKWPYAELNKGNLELFVCKDKGGYKATLFNISNANNPELLFNCASLHTTYWEALSDLSGEVLHAEFLGV